MTEHYEKLLNDSHKGWKEAAEAARRGRQQRFENMTSEQRIISRFDERLDVIEGMLKELLRCR